MSNKFSYGETLKNATFHWISTCKDIYIPEKEGGWKSNSVTTKLPGKNSSDIKGV